MSTGDKALLVGDIGGTNTRLAICSAVPGTYHPLAEATFPSRDYPSLEAILTVFLKDKKVHLMGASIGVAGPVKDDRVQVTNLPWVVDGQAVERLLGIPVHLLNDLAAIAHAIPFLEEADLETLNAGQPVDHGALAVIAPGTGLGEAFLVRDGTRYRPCASEGGHVDFAPTTPTEMELLTYLQPRLDHVSYESVCSGHGLPNLYAYLRDAGHYPEPDWLREQLMAVEDPTPVIVRTATENKAEICAAAIDLFVSILGSEAGNLALKILASGGVYVGGGIPPRILPQLKRGTFMKAFVRKGRFSDLLSSVPVHVIRYPQAGLMGAAFHGLETLDAAD
ncbi:MAG TPA: glucokinase [Aggregatilineaceae bacterium]|nr:glucokinase [Aggregatilineaceae bacterium]